MDPNHTVRELVHMKWGIFLTSATERDRVNLLLKSKGGT
jgi:hypothetical protein